MSLKRINSTKCPGVALILGCHSEEPAVDPIAWSGMRARREGPSTPSSVIVTLPVDAQLPHPFVPGIQPGLDSMNTYDL